MADRPPVIAQGEPARPEDLRWTISRTVGHSMIDGPYIGRIEVVPTSQLEGAVEENGRLRAQLEDARVRLDERRVMLDEREATIRRLTAGGQSEVTAPSVITARADVDLVERMGRELALGTDDNQDGGDPRG